MNTQPSRTFPSLAAGSTSGRAQFSPVLRHTAQTALTRHRVRAELREQNSGVIPDAETLTPPTPTLRERWWNPHLMDRLQPPLTRFRE
jgi:hypothetical protein